METQEKHNQQENGYLHVNMEPKNAKEILLKLVLLNILKTLLKHFQPFIAWNHHLIHSLMLNLAQYNLA